MEALAMSQFVNPQGLQQGFVHLSPDGGITESVYSFLLPGDLVVNLKTIASLYEGEYKSSFALHQE